MMESWSQFLGFMDGCAIYFTLQLVRCVIFSFAWIGLVMLLRKTLFSGRIFAKGILWASFLIIPFLGKMKLFYENAFVVKATWWLTGSIMTRTWIGHVYMLGVFLSFIYMFGKRIRLQRIVSPMEKQFLCGKSVHIMDMNVTPFTVGLLSPRIVLPRVMTDNYSGEEIEEVIRHEQIHIRLGHLWCYLAWEILRCLLWLNPLLIRCQRYFQSDMEAICDRVCIQNSGETAQEYGLLLLKSVKLLRSEQKNISSIAYAGEKDFEDMKKRMEKIADFRPYRKALCKTTIVIAVIAMCIIFLGIKNISYARCSEMENIFVYEYDTKNGDAAVVENREDWQQIISYDDDYVYVDRPAFESLLSDSNEEREVYIVFGGYQKLPGIGGNGNSCFYQRNSMELYDSMDSDNNIIRIPYEKVRDDWMTVLFKML